MLKAMTIEEKLFRYLRTRSLDEGTRTTKYFFLVQFAKNVFVRNVLRFMYKIFQDNFKIFMRLLHCLRLPFLNKVSL